MRTVDDALKLLAAEGLMTLTATRRPIPSLVVEVAGAPVRGSWWSHPAGKRIYALATALEDHPDVVTLKLVEGKVTFVHRRLWPALLRFATDRARRTLALKELPEAARRLLERVERRGEVRLDEVDGFTTAELKKARAAIEAETLAMGSSVHTGAGRHATVLRSFRHWATEDVADRATRLSFDEARELLRLV